MFSSLCTRIVQPTSRVEEAAGCIHQAVVLKFIEPTAKAYLFVPRWSQYSATALKVDRDTPERFVFYGRDTDYAKTLSWRSFLKAAVAFIADS